MVLRAFEGSNCSTEFQESQSLSVTDYFHAVTVSAWGSQKLTEKIGALKFLQK